MKKIFLTGFALFLSVFSTTPVFAQHDSTELSTEEAQTIFDEAEFYFDDANYAMAAPLYKRLSDKHPEDMLFKYRLGVCYLYRTDEKEKSIINLEEVYKQDPQTKDLLFYLGIAYHLNYRFDEALKFFNDFLATNPQVNKRVLTNKYIENCKNGKVLTQTKYKIDIKNLGPSINSRFSEYVPIISSDESILIFTYRGSRSKGGLMDENLRPAGDGSYYEDIFISHRIGKDWLSPESIGDNINTKGHDACIALSADGQKLFIYKSTSKDQGDIFISYLDGEVWSKPERLGPTINTKYWEGSVSMSSDEQTLYFASERKGGLGKRDIWMARKMEDGEWGEAINMGTNINTPLNEDAPFIHPDGVTLFFSSEGHNSMGGYDMMYSTFDNGEWSTPIDLDYPINTTEDDRFYVLSPDGERGYFSSDRKGGHGQQDIYVVTPGIQGEKPVLALVVGIATANNIPVDATINLFNAETDKKVSTHKANSISGKYILALTPGNKYKIAIEYEGMEPYIEYVDVKALNTYVQAKQDFKIFSTAYKQENNIIDSLVNKPTLQSSISVQLQNLKKTDNTMASKIYEEQTYQHIIKKYGDLVEDSVSYTIELGRYEDTADFNPAKIASLGTVEQKIQKDGTTLFSMRPFKTLLDAEIFKYKLLSRDSTFNTTSQVTVNDHGQRRLVQQYYKAEYGQRSYVPTEKKPVKSKYNLTPEPEDEKQINEIYKDFGTHQADGLEYKLEIASLKDTSQFNLGHLSKYGEITSKKYPDGYTRYTMGPFKTIDEVEAFKKKLAATDSVTPSKPFVTVFYFEQRKSLIEHFKKAPDTATAKKEPVITTKDTIPETKIEPALVAATDKDTVITSAKKEAAVITPKDTLTIREESIVVSNTPKDTVAAARKEPVVSSTQVKDTLTSLVEEFVAAAALGDKSTPSQTIPAPEMVTEIASEKTAEQPLTEEVNSNPPPVTTVNLSPCKPDSAMDFSFFAGKDLNEVSIYNQLIARAGNICAEGLIYKVQIGAYRHPENFKYPRLTAFGPAEIKAYPDGITRFTMREFKTLKEAEEFRQNVIGKGTKDAWITATVNGERKLLQDIIAVNFYTNSIN